MTSIKAALQHFQSTTDPFLTSYILPCGTMLDMGDMRGHDAIAAIYPAGTNGGEAIARFIGEGAVRTVHTLGTDDEWVGIQIGSPLTEQQLRPVRRFLGIARGRADLVVDYRSEDGREHSRRFPGARASALPSLLADAYRFFGIAPA